MENNIAFYSILTGGSIGICVATILMVVAAYSLKWTKGRRTGAAYDMSIAIVAGSVFLWSLANINSSFSPQDGNLYRFCILVFMMISPWIVCGRMSYWWLRLKYNHAIV